MPDSDGALWLFAGSNGAGKSTVLKDATSLGGPLEGIPVLNPDHLTKNLLQSAGYDDYATVPDDLYRRCFIQAATEMEQTAVRKLRAGQTVCIETVLSTQKYLRLVDVADETHAPFNLIYVVLCSSQLACKRVALRVARGGHPVPTDRIIERYTRSLDNLPVFAARASYFCVYDNSDSGPGAFPIPVAVGRAGKLHKIAEHCLPQIRDRLQTL